MSATKKRKRTSKKRSKRVSSHRELSVAELARGFESRTCQEATKHKNTPPRSGNRRVLWPQESDNAGVNPGQIGDVKKRLADQGVCIDFNPRTGAAIFTGYQHRKQVIKAMGMHDRSGFY